MSQSRFSRRDALRLSGAALGGVTLGSGTAEAAWDPANPPPGLTQQNTLVKSLPLFRLGEALDKQEMRITFMGTSPLERRSQMATSVFVELGCGDSFVFDAGMGCQVNYTAMQVPASRMRKIFLTHLHGDHTSDLTYLYSFGPQRDGKSPMYLWGPSKSYVRNPWYKHPQYPQYDEEPEYFDDGMLAFARAFREMNRWHSESQSFVGTRWGAAEGDGYDLVATELNWATGAWEGQWSNSRDLRNKAFAWVSHEPWVAYHDPVNKVKISYFQAVHDRNGSISYKLEWNGLSLIFSGDTKPNYFLLDALKGASAPVDLLIHEMVMPPEVWAAAANGGQAGPAAIATAQAVQENSHTPEKALGWLLSQAQLANRAPRLAAATHFQATDDTIRPALDAVRLWYQGPFTIVSDLVVINVSKSRIRQRRAVVSDFSPSPPTVDPRLDSGTFVPKYNDPRPTSPYAPYGFGPLEQLSPVLLDQVIPPCLFDPTAFNCQTPYGPYNPPPNPPGVTGLLRRR